MAPEWQLCLGQLLNQLQRERLYCTVRGALLGLSSSLGGAVPREEGSACPYISATIFWPCCLSRVAQSRAPREAAGLPCLLRGIRLLLGLGALGAA